MKKLLLFLPLILLLGCSIQKRKYQNGYYVEWHKKAAKKESLATKTSRKPASKHKAESPETLVAKEEIKGEEVPGLDFTTQRLQKTLRSTTPPEDTCDVLVFKDGSEIKGKVKEVGTSEIKYKRCDTPDGPTYISKNSDIFMIKYANGTREVIKSEPQQRVQSPEPIKTRNPNSNSNNDYRKTKYNRQIHPLAVASLVFAVLALIILYAALVFASGGISFPLAALILPFIFSLIAVITGISSMRTIKQQPELFKGKGLAMPGMIIGFVVVGIYVLALFILLIILSGF